MYYLLIFLAILLIVVLKGPACRECGQCDASASYNGLCDTCWLYMGDDNFDKK